VSPLLALNENVVRAAAGEHRQAAKHQEADRIPTNPTHHGVDNALYFVNDSSKLSGINAALAGGSHYG
jgi:hypothetical protein